MQRLAIWLAVSSQAQANEDKVSLQEQERLGREFAEQNNMVISAIYRVDGYSRHEPNFVRLLEAMERVGNTAYHDLMHGWEYDEFDVLWVHEQSRLARSKSVYTTIVESIIRKGKRLYFHEGGGWVDKSNYDLHTMAGSFFVDMNTRHLQAKRKAAIYKRMEKGLPAYNNQVIYPYTVLRNSTGKAYGITPRDDVRTIYTAAARLIIEGVGWQNVEYELTKMGYVNPDTGKPFSKLFFYRQFYHPTLYGHTAFMPPIDGNYSKTEYFGDWMWDKTVDPPEGVVILHDTHEPYFKNPALLDALTGELKWRVESERGARTPVTKYMFSGLCICGECGSVASIRGGNYNPPRYGCQHHKTDTTKRDFVCPQASGTKAVKEPVIKEWFNKHYLQPLVNGSDLASLLPEETNEDELAMLEADAEETRDKLATLTQRLASVNASAARVVTERMNTLGTQLETTEKRIEEIKANYRAINRRQLRTARNVSFNYEAFWNRPAHMIQRDVRDLLGDYRFTLRDGDVIGLTHTG